MREICLFPPHLIYSFNHLYQYEIIDINCILCIIINTNYFLSHITPVLATRNSFCWFPCPFDNPPPPHQCGCFSLHFLTSDTQKVYFLPQPWHQPFSQGAFTPFIEENEICMLWINNIQNVFNLDIVFFISSPSLWVIAVFHFFFS